MRTRASETFERELEAALRPGSSSVPRPGGADASLVEVALSLREAARPVATLVPRQQFREALAERLRAEAEQLAPERRAAAVARVVPRPRPTPSRSSPGRRVRGIAAGLAAAVVVGGAGAAVASENALPGGPLYPLKRQVEELRLSLAAPGQARGGAELDLARERLEEAERLTVGAEGALSGGTEQDVRGTLEDFGGSARSGISALTLEYAVEGDADALASVDGFLDEVLPLLERLRTMTPPELHPTIDALLLELGDQRLDLADAVASCGPACRDVDVVVAEPATAVTSPPQVGPGGGPVVSAPVATVATSEGTGGVQGPAQPVDPLPVGPAQTLLEDLLSAPATSSSAPAASAPVPAPPPTQSGSTLLPGVSLPPLLPSSSPSSSACLLPLLGCD